MTENNEQIEKINDKNNILINNIFKNIGQVTAIVITTIYFTGFIVVTTYLGKYGLRDYEAFRIQYLIAGTLLWISYGLIYYFLSDIINNTLNNNKNSSTNNICDTLDFFILFFDSIILCTFVAGILLFDPLYNNIKYNLFIIAFFIGRLIIKLKSEFEKENTRTTRILIRIFLIFSAIAFVINAPVTILILGIFYLVMSMSTILLAEKYKSSSDKLNLYYLIYFLLVSGSIIFGATVYNKIKTSIGGGSPIVAKFIFKEYKTIPVELINSLEIKNGTSSSFNLLAETENEFFIETNMTKNSTKKIIRIKKEQIQAIITE